MLEIRKRSLFKRDLKAFANNPAALEKICAIVFRLANGETLPPSCREHPLKGDYAGTLECHAAPDLLLVYVRTETELVLFRVGSHAALFK